MSEEEYYSNDGGMVSDSATRKHKSSKTKIPNIKIPRVPKRVPHSEFGNIMGNLTLGMLFVFPAIALLTVAFPKAVFSIIGLIVLVTGLWSQSFKGALIVLGICLAPVVLGFLSIGLFMAILG